MGKITQRARDLRKAMTESEHIFWESVRYRKLGFTFHRQKPLRFYEGKHLHYFIADFFCKELKLFVEIDGKIHEQQKDYDKARTYIINQLGYRVIRFTNQKIQTELQACLVQILSLPSPL